METKEFVRQLNAWLEPAVIADSAARFEVDQCSAEAAQGLYIRRASLSAGGQAVLTRQIQRYLDGFQISDDYVSLLAGIVPLQAATWRWVAGLRFTGAVRLLLETDPSQASDPPLLVIQERDSFLDIVLQPIECLARQVEHYDNHWAKMSAMTSASFLRPSAQSPFLIEIEAAVAETHGVPTRGPGDGVHIRFGATTIVGRPPLDPKLVTLVRDKLALGL